MRQNYREGDEPVPGYQLKRWLGEGGFGVAWRAKAPGGTEVAMKMIDLGAKNALKEIRALGLVKQIRHPNLTPILALWLRDSDGNVREYSEADSQELLAKPTSPALPKDTMLVDSDTWRSRPAELIMAMGLGDKTLSDRLDECTASGLEGIPPDELLEYLESAAKAIDYLNSAQHNIQHCDIKPQNILIVGGAAQVCDFGLARALQDNRATKVAVSYAYAAPESFQSKPSHATDQYSLAITYVELRTGALPFDDESIMGVMNAHINGTLNLARLPEGEREVIRRATAVKPEQRYDSALKMVRALRRAFESTADPTATPAPLVQSTPVSATIRQSTTDEVVPGYRPQKLIARSSSEEVWEATAPGGKRVALVIRELAESAAALDLEALSLVLRTGHPNLTEMLAFWLIDQEGNVLPDAQLANIDRSRLGKLVLAGKLSASTMLQLLSERRQRSGKGIAPVDLLPLIRQAATALDFLNTRQHKSGLRKVGILHCNVQPSNLLLYNTTLRLGNFGRSRALDADVIEDSVAAAGFEMAYTPPEVFEGQLTRWTDQYGLALSYIHLRAGKPAFDAASSTTRLIQLHRSGELDFRELPEREVEVLRRATSIVPSQRFNTCTEFLDELSRACNLSKSGGLSGTTPSLPAQDSAAEKIRTQPIGGMVTQALDESISPDTAPEDSSVIETQPLVEPRPRVPQHLGVTSDFPGAEAYLAEQAEREAAIRAAMQAAAPKGRGTGAKLLAGVMLVAVVALVGALAWAIWPEERGKQTSYVLEFTALTDRVKAPDVGHEELNEIAEKLAALINNPDAQEAYALLRDKVSEALATIEAQSLNDPGLNELEAMLSQDKLPNADAPDAGKSYVEFVQSVLEKKLALDKRAQSDEAFKDAMNARLRDKLANLQEKARRVAQANPQSDDAKPLLELLLQLDPTDAKTLMALSRLALSADGIDSAQSARQILGIVGEPQLASIIPPDGQATAREEWEFLKAWLTVRMAAGPLDANQASPEAEESINRALAQLVTSLSQSKPQLSDAEVTSVTRDIAALWQEKPEFTASSRGALRAASTVYPQIPAAQRHYALLLDRWLPENLAKEAELNSDWFAARNADCDVVLAHVNDPEFKNLPLVKLLKAECLLASESTLSPDELKAVEQQVSNAGDTPKEFRAYRAYVQGRVRPKDSRDVDWNRLAETVDEFLQAMASDDAAGMSAPVRRNQAGELAALAAIHLRVPQSDSDKKQVEYIIGNRWGDQAQAARAAKLLDASRNLLTATPSTELLANLSLAAFHGAQPKEFVQETVSLVMPKLDEPRDLDNALQDDKLALTWVSARTQTDDVAGHRADIEQTARVVKEYSKANRLDRLDLEQAKVLYEKVVAPALAAVDASGTLDDTVVKKPAAQLFATKGELFFYHKGLDEPAKAEGAAPATSATNKTALEAFDRAIELDSDTAEYFAGRARINLNNPDKAEADLELALSKAPNYAFALYLRALIHTRKAEPPGLTLEQRLELFGKAREACEVAIKLIPPGDRNRTDSLILLANAHVNLANYVLEFADKEQHLNDAVAKAKEAIEDTSYPTPELAWRVLGNAQEDLAWIIGRNGKPELEDNYEKAVDSFETAANLAPDVGDAWRDLGRAEYKWAADRTPDPKRVDDPRARVEQQELLTNALHHAQLAQEKQNKPVDAPYWQAMALFRLGRYSEACDQFSQYFAEGKLWAPDFYGDYALCAFESLQSAHDSLEKRRPIEDLPQRIIAARACADRLDKLKERTDLSVDATKTAQALRFMAQAIEGQPDTVLVELESTLPDLQAATASDLYLLTARVQCRLLPDCTKDEFIKPGAKSFELVLDSNRLANLAGEVHVQYRSTAYEAAALAYAKAVNFSMAAIGGNAAQQKRQANTIRAFGIELYRVLIATNPHHPNSWLWRVQAATLLTEEIRANTANKVVKLSRDRKSVTDQALRQEGIDYLEYAQEVAPTDERGRIGNQIQRLKSATPSPN